MTPEEKSLIEEHVALFIKEKERGLTPEERQRQAVVDLELQQFAWKRDAERMVK